MDLTELIRRHRTSLSRAKAAACVEARVAHLGLAGGYAIRIEAMRVIALGDARAVESAS